MQNNQITIGVHSQKDLSEKTKGLITAFNEIGFNAMSTSECSEKDITPNLAIGFDEDGLSNWQKNLIKGIPNMMWSTDSIFIKNYEIIKQFSSFKNFILLNSTTADNKAITKFLPQIMHGYLPLGVDTDFWTEGTNDKDIDIAVIGSITDSDSEIEKLKNTMPELVFNLMMETINLALLNPALSLNDICNMFQEQMDLEFTDEQIILFMTSLSGIITTKIYEKVLECLKKIDGISITLAGNDNCKKYQTENISVINTENEEQVRDIIQRAKAVITISPYSKTGGIDELLLKIAACKTLVITPTTPLLINEFKETFCYFNPVTVDNLESKIIHYLNNDTERENLAKGAQQIVREKHCWKNRAQAIADILQIN